MDPKKHGETFYLSRSRLLLSLAHKQPPSAIASVIRNGNDYVGFDPCIQMAKLCSKNDHEVMKHSRPIQMLGNVLLLQV